MKKENKPDRYVVGQKDEETGYSWLLGVSGEHDADDQNLEIAEIFTSVEEAENAADQHDANVFLIVDETTWPATLEEIS